MIDYYSRLKAIASRLVVSIFGKSKVNGFPGNPEGMQMSCKESLQEPLLDSMLNRSRCAYARPHSSSVISPTGRHPCQAWAKDISSFADRLWPDLETTTSGESQNEDIFVKVREYYELRSTWTTAVHLELSRLRSISILYLDGL